MARLLPMLTALSAVLFAASATLWVRTWFATDEILASTWDPARRDTELYVRNGADFLDLRLMRFNVPPVDPPGVARRRVGGLGVLHETYPPRQSGLGSWLWWDHYVDRPSQSGWIECWRVQVRPWLIVAVTAVAPAVWLRRFAQRRRDARQGLCANCGYDLRASPSRCPECGMPCGVLLGPA